jgi:phosphopantetheine adenylyltransferase
MKSFSKFITEATSKAVQQATRMGLVTDGHGGWYNRGTGEFSAKTVRGELKFYNKRQIIGAKDPAQTEQEKNLSQTSYAQPASQPAPQKQAPQEPVPQEQIPQDQVPVDQQQVQEPLPQEPFTPPPVEKTLGTLTIAFGRFNPPTVGHLQLMDTAASSAEQDQSDYIIVPSRSQDAKKNPLDADTKIFYMRKMFPQHSERIYNDVNMRTIFDVLKKAHNDGYSSVRIVGGSDRVKEFDKLANNYNGNLYQFDNIEVISSGDRDPDSDGVEGVSASRMRLASAEGDFKTFRAGLPPEVSRKDAMELFDVLRQSMGIEEIQQEGYDIWEIAPKFDAHTLRENYISEKIFQIGQLVENLNTGLVGRIIRRGTNYLIYVTENGMMFKSWIKDLMETKKYTEVRMDSEMRAPGKPNTLVGTLGAFKHYASKTPGAVGTGAENLQPDGKAYGINFINKYRKK